MSARLHALDPADMTRCGVPVDSLPSQVANLRSPQPMRVSHQDHCRVTMAVTIAFGDLDQFFNFSLGQMLSAAKLAVRLPSRGNCSFFDGWRDQLQARLAMVFASYHSSLLVQYTFYEQWRGGLATMVSEFCRLPVVIRSADAGASGRAASLHDGHALDKRRRRDFH